MVRGKYKLNKGGWKKSHGEPVLSHLINCPACVGIYTDEWGPPHYPLYMTGLHN